MSPVLAGLIGTIVTAIVSLVVGIGSSRSNRARAEIESKATPYDALAERVTRLESQIDALRTEVADARDEAREMRAYAELLRRHITDQLPPPPPDWPIRKELL